MHSGVITLFSRLHFVATTPATPSHSVSDALNIAQSFNTELAAFGYTADPALMAQLIKLHARSFDNVRLKTLEMLAKITGDSVTHHTVMRSFPRDERRAGAIRTFIASKNGFTPAYSASHRASFDSVRTKDGREVYEADMGHWFYRTADVEWVAEYIRRSLGDFSSEMSPAAADFQQITPLKVLGFADDAFLRAEATAMLGRKSSLSRDDAGFLTWAIDTVGADWPDEVYRESLPFLYRAFEPSGGIQPIADVLTGATDVLRIAVYLSDPAADLSLKEPARFKLTTGQKNRMLFLLEGLGDIREDLMRHRERWLRFGEHVHVGSRRNRFPHTARAFADLRKRPGEIVTFNRTVEQKIISRTIDQKLVDLLATRPGMFMRRLDSMLRSANDPRIVLDALTRVVDGVNPKMLVEIDAYLQHRQRAEPGAKRFFAPKGPGNKLKLLEDRRKAIPEDLLTEARMTVLANLMKRHAALPPMGKVFVDERFSKVILPFNRRGDSETSNGASKGARYPIGNGAFLRCFLYWKANLDVDLSVKLYSADFEDCGTCSYYQLEDDGLKHSGDVLRAPEGGSEFIDIDRRRIIQRGVRYILMSVINFSGEPLSDISAFAGFMERDAIRSGQVYEPASVALKFHLSAASTTYMPLLFDLIDEEVVFIDMGSDKGGARSVDSISGSMLETAIEFLKLGGRKPNVYDLLTLTAAARGEVVETEGEADRVFRYGEIDINDMVDLVALEGKLAV